MLLVADVHGADVALKRVASLGQPLLVLGDLVNLIDYRTGEGIVADVVGLDTVTRISDLRSRGLHDEATAVWFASVEDREVDVRSAVGRGMKAQYERMQSALVGAEAYVMYGNVDRPDMLREHLPASARFVDADVVEIGGWTVGFVGGGMPRLGTSGEISSADMAKKLERIGDVDILCTHVPPAIEALGRDVIGGGFKGSVEVLEYIDRVQPQFHYFGDVHQPQATRWRRGSTTCRNVGYFRATGRPYEHV